MSVSVQSSRGAWPANTLLDRLPPNVVTDLLALGGVRRYAVGEILIRQGDDRDHVVHLLQSTRVSRPACVKVVAALPDGGETLLGIRVSGDLVGELAPLSNRPRSATVVACSPTLTRAIPGEVFRAFLDRNPVAWSAVTRMIADRLSSANHHRLEIAQHGVTARLAHVLAQLVERHGQRRPGGGHDLGIGLTHYELGQLIGAREDAVGKALRTLKGRGLVSVGYRQIIVFDPLLLRGFHGE